ncbi:EamA family transporter [Hominifimenecus sp. rT4P-3]|uniref:EamA family transporter n=1 Tax=Hominifimenecus sp. rT4P-3 TaxID=3242979 RepID=UPI003DA40E27
MNRYIVLFLFSVLISSISQIMLKASANRKYENWWKEYLNPQVFFAYSLFFVSSLVTTISYRNVPLSMGGILESSGYIFITILGVLFLKEHVSRRKIMGLIVILLGIYVFNL